MRKHHVRLGEEEVYLKKLGIQDKLMKKWSHLQMGRGLLESPEKKEKNKKEYLKKISTAIILRQDAFHGTKRPSNFNEVEENKI